MEAGIEQVRDLYEAQLMDLPGVVGVAIGERVIRGERQAGEPAIKVFVRQKRLEADLAPQERVPRHLEGYPTDVEEIGKIVAFGQ